MMSVLRLFIKEELRMKLEIVDSPVLLKSHVEIIDSRLQEAPRLFSMESVPVKPISVKLFYGRLTFYVVEYDPRRRLAFGCMEETYQNSMSRWGHVSIDELIRVGFEMDIGYQANSMMILSHSPLDRELYHV